MPLAKITLDSEHTDCCTCGHTWALHSNIYGWCVLCDCKQYVQEDKELDPQAEPEIKTPKGKLKGQLIFMKPEHDPVTLARSFNTLCVCNHTWGKHLHAHPTARCGFCSCSSFSERKEK